MSIGLWVHGISWAPRSPNTLLFYGPLGELPKLRDSVGFMNRGDPSEFRSESTISGGDVAAVGSDGQLLVGRPGANQTEIFGDQY
jgi:hypothetical protein